MRDRDGEMEVGCSEKCKKWEQSEKRGEIKRKVEETGLRGRQCGQNRNHAVNSLLETGTEGGN